LVGIRTGGVLDCETTGHESIARNTCSKMIQTLLAQTTWYFFF
jgi:hypothetical protein